MSDSDLPASAGLGFTPSPFAPWQPAQPAAFALPAAGSPAAIAPVTANSAAAAAIINACFLVLMGSISFSFGGDGNVDDGARLLPRVVRRDRFDVAIGERIGHRGHRGALARSAAIGGERLL